MYTKQSVVISSLVLKHIFPKVFTIYLYKAKKKPTALNLDFWIR